MGLEDMVTSVTGADTIIILRVMVVLCGVILFSASVPFSEAKHWKFIKKNPDILDDNLMNILFYEKGFLDKKIKTEILRGIVLTLYTILCKCLFSEVTVQAVTELDNKAAHCHTPVPQRHRPFL